jgi:regulator of sigma E protease
MSEVVPYVLAAIGFMLLIALHELGHMVAAKANDMRVERYAVFFPPFIARKRWGETEYALGVIPLGGYAKITGMNPEEKLPPDVAPRGYYNKPVWRRVVVILAGPGVNLLLAFLLLFGLAFGAAKLTSRVGEILPGSPAESALRPGDRVISIDGRRGDQLDFQRQISSHRCPGTPRDGCRARTPAVLRVERAGRVVTVRVRPRYDAEVKRTRIGFTYANEPLDPGPIEAADAAVTLMWGVTTATVEAIARVFDPEKRKELSGVVGSYEVTRQAFTFSIRDALTVLAVISLSLAVINLFPFLPLDGGHVLLGVLEKVTGRRTSWRVVQQFSAVGFILVFFLFFIGLSNDIGRLTGGGFQTR